MKLRVKLVNIILRKNIVIVLLPVIIAYCLLPIISLVKYFSLGVSEARNIFIYMAQVFIPLCGLLWPMGYVHIWVEGNGCETLRACSTYHKSCIGELFLLYGVYLLIILPTIVFAVVLYQVSWLEYIRLILQFAIVINLFYFMVMLFRNVTIGCIPVIMYLLFCFYISGSADFSLFSIIEPNLPAEHSNWNTLLILFPVSFVALLLGYLSDRFGIKYN